MPKRLMIAVGLAVVTACTGASPTTTSGSTTTLGSLRPGPIVFLPGFDAAFLRVGEEIWTVAVADTSELRAQGLGGVEDLSWVDGMIFEWDEDVSSGLSMKGTLMTFDLAFVSEEGRIIEVVSTTPCTTNSCPLYAPGTPFRYALAASSGRLDDVNPNQLIGPLPPRTLTEIAEG